MAFAGLLPFQLVFGVEIWLLLLLFLILPIVLLVLSAVWMYRDANSRAMDGSLWVVILIIASIFGTVIGWLIVFVIYVVVRENHPVGGRPYPYGYAPYGPYAQPPYGYPYYPPPQGTAPGAPPAAAPPQAAAMPVGPTKCPKCGSPTAFGARFCANCGSAL